MSGDQLPNNQRPLYEWHPPWMLHRSRTVAHKGNFMPMADTSASTDLCLFVAPVSPPPDKRGWTAAAIPRSLCLISAVTHVKTLLNTSIKRLQFAASQQLLSVVEAAHGLVPSSQSFDIFTHSIHCYTILQYYCFTYSKQSIQALPVKHISYINYGWLSIGVGDKEPVLNIPDFSEKIGEKQVLASSVTFMNNDKSSKFVAIGSTSVHHCLSFQPCSHKHWRLSNQTFWPLVAKNNTYPSTPMMGQKLSLSTWNQENPIQAM